MCVPIEWVSRDTNGTITHVGGSSPRGVVWGLSKAEATPLIEQQLWEFFVEVGGARVPVFVVDRSSSKFLTMSPNGLGANDLDNLPTNPQPVAGVLPEFPLSIPGVKAMGLMRVRSVQYASGGQLRPLVSQVLEPGIESTKLTPSSSFWTQSPRWLYLDVLVPFPCEVTVHEVTSLTRVPGDSPAARRALEEAGKGRWTTSLRARTARSIRRSRHGSPKPASSCDRRHGIGSWGASTSASRAGRSTPTATPARGPRSRAVGSRSR